MEQRKTVSAVCRRAGLAASITMALLVASGCGGGTENTAAATDAAKARQTTTTEKPTPTTEFDADKAGLAYETALADSEEIRVDAKTRRDDAADEGDVSTALAEIRRYRNGLFAFDEAVREIVFPGQFSNEVNDLLEVNGQLIADLDAYQNVTDADGYNEKVAIENEDMGVWFAAADDLAAALGVTGTVDVPEDDGIRVDDAGGGANEPETLGEGEVVEGAGYSVVVPPGFSGFGGGTIHLEGPNEATISTGLLSDYSGEVAVVAKQFSEAAAEKEGAAVNPDPFQSPVGSETGIGYVLMYPDGTADMQVVTIQGGLIVTLILHAPAEQLVEVEPEFSKLLASFQITG